MGVGFRQVGDLHLLGVPIQAFARKLAGDHRKAANGTRLGVQKSPSFGLMHIALQHPDYHPD